MINPRLRTYALAATGSATLVAGGATNADIITSAGPVDIPPASTYGPVGSTLFTVDGHEFKAFHFTDGSWYDGFNSVGLDMAGGGLDIGYASEGSTIGVGASFSRSYAANYMYFFGSTLTAQYTNGMPIGTSVLLGFSISDADDTFYGWIDYSLSLFQNAYTFTINRWAYNDVAGQGIIAGQNQAAGSSAVPGLGGLAALAIGAAGVRSRRQRTVA